MPLQRGWQLPNWCDTPTLALSFTQAHLCDTPIATYPAIIVRYPNQNKHQQVCDTIATSIARYEKYHCWASLLSQQLCCLELRKVDLLFCLVSSLRLRTPGLELWGAKVLQTSIARYVLRGRCFVGRCHAYFLVRFLNMWAVVWADT